MAQIEYDLGTIGTGITKTLLFEGSASSTGTYDLNANVLNYNLIIVEHKSSHDLQKIQAQPFCTISTAKCDWAYPADYHFPSPLTYIFHLFSYRANAPHQPTLSKHERKAIFVSDDDANGHLRSLFN